MKKTMKRAVVLLLSLAGVLCLSLSAFADGASVIYEGTAQKFIFSPGSDHSPVDLFHNFKDVMPGDFLTQKITVKNDISNKVKVNIYLRSFGAQEGSEEFLSNMHLTVTQDGNSELFSAPADQTAELNDWVCLGTFYSGADVNLDLALEVPTELGDAFQNASGTLIWEFRAEELPVEPTDPQPPQTGESAVTGLYVGASFAGVGLLLLLLTARRKRSAEECS